MAKALFKSYNQGGVLMFPASFEDEIPQNSPVRLISQIVDKLDISSVLDTYSGGGTTSYHPRMLLKVIFYAYTNNIYSCRKIFKQLQEDIHYIWLSGNQTPDFRTINNFRSLHLKDTIHELFTQVVLLLVEMGHLSIQTVYVDETKLESQADRYIFVWRKNDDPPAPVNSDELKKRIAAINAENLNKDARRAVKKLQNTHLPELEE
jgi:transposase